MMTYKKIKTAKELGYRRNKKTTEKGKNYENKKKEIIIKMLRN